MKHENDTPISAMTLRDKFADSALRSLLSQGQEADKHQLAIEAYEIADAMLARRAETEPPVPSLEGVGPVIG